MKFVSSNWNLAFFSAPAFGISALGLPLVVYLPQYYSGHLGLALGTVGVAFLLARVLDIFADPWIGNFIGATSTRYGRYRPWLIGGTPLLVGGAYFLFMAEPGVSIAYLWLALVVTYLGYSICLLSHMAWAASLSENYDTRSRVYGWWQAANGAGLLAILILPVVVAHFFGPDEVTRIRGMGWFIVVVFPVAILLAVTMTLEPRTPPPAAGQEHLTGLKPYLALLKYVTARQILACAFLIAVAHGFGASLIIFFLERILVIPKATVPLVLLSYFFAALLGAPAWAYIGRKMQKHRAFFLASALYAVTQVPLLFLPVGQVVPVVSLLLICGLLYPASSVLLRAMLADVGDEIALGSMRDLVPNLFAGLAAMEKLGYAVAVGVSFLVLEWVGFKAGAPSELGTSALLFMFVIVPAILAVVACLLTRNYTLTAAMHSQMRARLAERTA